MKNYFFCFIVIFFSFNNVQSQSIFSLSLKNLDGSIFKVSELKKNKASVFVFISPECLLCQNYALTLSEQQKQFASKKIKYYGIVSGKSFTIQEINHYKKLFNADFIILRDENYELKKALNATKTPEVFLIDNTGKIKYSGRIDDWFIDSEKRNTKANEHNLKDAVNALLNNKSLKARKTTAVGCLLE